ncbi:hypothetical protein BH11MYX1_BH11MYX1_53900 [soil metagenome]
MLNRGDLRTLIAIVTTAILAATVASLLVRPDRMQMHDLETRVRTLEIAATRIPP